MLAALVKNFIRERRVNVCNSARKQQRTDHLAEQSNRLATAAFADPLGFFDDLGESLEVHREPLCVGAARDVVESAGVADKTRPGATRLDIRAMLGRQVPLNVVLERVSA